MERQAADHHSHSGVNHWPGRIGLYPGLIRDDDWSLMMLDRNIIKLQLFVLSIIVSLDEEYKLTMI